MTTSVILCTSDHGGVGSQAPNGYGARIAWHAAHERAGVRQSLCPSCGLWKYPQEECCGKPASSRVARISDLGGTLGKAPRARIVHMASKVDPRGRVSALCFVRPRAIDRRATWTIRAEAVTCAKCRARLEEASR